MFLRLSLPDCLIAAVILSFVSGFVPSIVSTDSKTVVVGLSAAIGLSVYLVVAPPLYWLFRLRPMHYPPCPYCVARAGPWVVPSCFAPRIKEDLLCGQCGQLVEFWFATPRKAQISVAIPAFILRWPRPFGLWRLVGRVLSTDAQQSAPGEGSASHPT